MAERPEVTRVILSVLGLAGLLTVAVLAPNAVQAMAKLGFTKRHYRQYLPKAIERLKKKGLIEVVKSGGKQYYCLTQKGEKLLASYERKAITIKKPKKWDEKYRVVIFDIKEQRRSARDEIRNWLVDLGFVRLQNSVWVFPYECREVITLLKADKQIGKDIIYMTVEEIENDGWLKKHFNLT
jgi:CRISPR-associated endonuclease Cas2